MIGIILTVIGGLWGWREATKRGGNRADKLQYAAIYALIFGVTGMLIFVLLDRMI